MVGWHHQLDRHEFEQVPRVGEGLENVVCCSTWGCRESDINERVNNNIKYIWSNVSVKTSVSLLISVWVVCLLMEMGW